MRLVSICPSNTELIGYLGLTDQLVGVDNDSTWPPSISTLPKLGPDLSIDMDAVERLHPDLVLASLSVPGMEKNIEELTRRNIPHVVYSPNSLSDIYSDILSLGEKTGVKSRAEALVCRMQSLTHQYKTLADQIKEKPSLYFEWWPKPVFTPGKTNWLTELSELAGGHNIFSDIPKPSVQTTFDDVVKRNPAYFFLVWVGVAEKKMSISHVVNRTHANDIHAVQQNHIYTLKEELYCRPSPRLWLGLKKLAFLIHPDVFPVDDNIDPLLQ